jgi:hypothetical protein
MGERVNNDTGRMGARVMVRDKRCVFSRLQKEKSEGIMTG